MTQTQPRGKKVLVTGVSGFLAPHVAKTFKSEGYHVIACDSRPEAVPTWASSAPWHEFRQVALDDRDGAAAAVREVDVVCHLAGVGDVYLAFERPDVAASANVVATATLLEAAKTAGVQKLVYASTWEVYGAPQYQPLDEAHACAPDHPYNITKYAGERLCIAYDHLKGLPTLALRLGTAFGRGMRPNSVFSIFIRKARAGEALTIAGDGTQGRQFTHASDIGRAFYLAATSPARGEALNTVAREMISIKQLATAVAARYPVAVEHGPARVGDIAPSAVSSARAKEVLGWEPRVELDQALAELFDEAERLHPA